MDVGAQNTQVWLLILEILTKGSTQSLPTVFTEETGKLCFISWCSFFKIAFCSLFHGCSIFYFICDSLSNILKISSPCFGDFYFYWGYFSIYLFVLISVFQGRHHILLRKLV